MWRQGKASVLPGYVLHNRLDAGDGAMVWRAEQTGRPGRVLAVKLVAREQAPDNLRPLRRQVEALQQARVPGVLTPLEVIEADEQLALVLPYAPGGSLADRIGRGDPTLTPSAVAHLAVRAARSLADLHDTGLTHGAITTADILFDGEGRPLLSGVGRALLRDTPPATPQADVADLAAACRAGLRADQAPEVAALLERAASEEGAVTTARQLAAELERAEVAQLEHDAVAHPGIEKGGAEPPTTPRESRRARPWWVAAALLALVGTVTAVWLLSDRGPRDLPLSDRPGDLPRPAATREAAAQPSPDLPLAVTVPPPCQDVPAPAPDAGQQVHLVDVDGRGCTVPVLWDGRILTVPATDTAPRRYELDAAESDHLLFGDWSCDGRFSPALYRPSTGHAFLFEGFAAAGEEITVDGTQTGVIDGEPVVVEDDGCHRLEVLPGG